MMSVNWSEFAMRQPFLTDLGEGSSAAEGMAKLSSIFASVIEPITTGSGT